MWLFVGPSLKAGVGQVVKKYCTFMNGEYCQLGEKPKESKYSHGFLFLFPDVDVDYYISLCESIMVMTVCETKQLNTKYKQLLKYKPLYLPSQFCIDVFTNQYPEGEYKLLRHYTPIPKSVQKQHPYTFYTIGNIVDPRKNINLLLECITIIGARLLIKSTGLYNVKIPLDNVVVINHILDDESMNNIHDACDCYINCSHSEGVGMGAVESALRNKPVIITDYGGLKEYVHTPYIVSCTEIPLGYSEYLYEKDMVWGNPNKEELLTFMKECLSQDIRVMDHSFTRELMKTFSWPIINGQQYDDSPTGSNPDLVYDTDTAL
jgi:glycosyltransferase involved in cell wall biosynthesis